MGMESLNLRRYILMSLVLLLLIWRCTEARYGFNIRNVVVKGDKGSFWSIYLSFCLVLGWSMIDFYVFGLTQMRLLYPYVNFFGFSVFLLGYWVRYVSRKQLGEYFNEEISLTNGHQLVKDGIYTHLRHPSYSGILLLGLAIPLICSDYGGILGFVVLLVPAVLYRIRVEESFLIEKFGNEYREYCKSTKRLIPNIY